MQNVLPFTDEPLVVDAIERGYDSLPYVSKALSFTHPSRLGALGYVNCLNCARPSRCRVLEIGGASGGNLLLIALSRPASEFVGVDLSAVQFAQARRSAAALSINNVGLIAADVRELPHEAMSKTDDLQPRWMDSSLRAAVNEFLHASNDYLFHEYLNRVNQPERMSQLLADTEQRGLRYIADADWSCIGRFARTAT